MSFLMCSTAATCCILVVFVRSNNYGSAQTVDVHVAAFVATQDLWLGLCLGLRLDRGSGCGWGCGWTMAQIVDVAGAVAGLWLKNVAVVVAVVGLWLKW